MEVFKSTLNLPTEFIGAVGLPSTSVSLAKTFTVPLAPSSVNGVAVWLSSFATGTSFTDVTTNVITA